MDNLNSFTGTVRRCVDDYGMIDEGDVIAVGVSGGKDSLVLLRALKHLQSFYPKRFDVLGLTLELGFEGMDFAPVAEMCRQEDIPYTCIKTDIKEIVFDVRKEENPCSLCARMRRGALHDACVKFGCNKLALGHHFNDAVETFVMNLFNEGRIGCFSPKTHLSRKNITLIRPMVLAPEKEIRRAANKNGLKIVKSKCPADGRL